MIEKQVRNMETFTVTIALLLAVATFGHCQIMGDPGAEPWNMVIATACQVKNVDLTFSMAKATQCLQDVGADNPVRVCGLKKERNECLKPYYNELKKCFDKDSDVDKAFMAQKEAAEYFCQDNGKKFSQMTEEDLQCEQKDTSKCLLDKMKSAMPDFSSIFNDKNCKILNGVVECGEESFKDCKTMKMKDAIIGQYKSMLGETPCGGSGAGSAVFAAPILLFALLCQALAKSLF